MTSEIENLRDKDHTILQHIQNGHNDTQKITSNTTLQNHHINYSLQKLADLDLITLQKPDTMVERVINGQKRVFQHPKQAQLTEKAKQYLEQTEQEDLDKYEDLTHKELVQEVYDLKERVQTLENGLATFQRQVQNKL